MRLFGGASIDLIQHSPDLGDIACEIVVGRMKGASLQLLQNRRDLVQFVKNTGVRLRNQTGSLVPNQLQFGEVTLPSLKLVMRFFAFHITLKRTAEPQCWKELSHMQDRSNAAVIDEK